MKRPSYFPVLVLILGMSVSTSAQDTSLSSLIEAERSFASMSVSAGMKKAFLTYLADEAVLFRPGPVNGKAVWEQAKETTARLEWHPTFAFVSSGGDLGYTSGPWIFTPAANLDQPPRHGYFVSLWKKQGDAKWKVVLDLGTSNENPPVPDTSLTTLTGEPGPRLAKPDPEQERDVVIQLEEQFSQLSNSTGLQAAFAKYLSRDARFYREGHFPVVGRNAILAKQDVKSTFSTKTDTCFIAESADLACTYGSYNNNGVSSPESGYFVRIWRKEGGNWYLALDILSPSSEGE